MSQNTDQELEQALDSVKPQSFAILLYSTLIFIVVWGIIGFIPWWVENGYFWTLNRDTSDAGRFGDSFGFVNSLLSALALAGVVASLWLQRLELTEQRKELKITRLEIKKSTEAEEKTAKELNLQSKLATIQAFQSSLQGLYDFGTYMDGTGEQTKRRRGHYYITIASLYRLELLKSLHDETKLQSLVKCFNEAMTALEKLLLDHLKVNNIITNIEPHMPNRQFKVTDEAQTSQMLEKLQDPDNSRLFDDYLGYPFSYPEILKQSNDSDLDAALAIENKLLDIRNKINDKINQLMIARN
jgi:hypothetical protein